MPEPLDELVALYRAELLRDPPIASLQRGAKDPAGASWHFAKKDVGRLMRAVEAAGFVLTLTRSSEVERSEDS